MIEPHNMNAEQSVLGALLTKNDLYELARYKITEKDFYHKRHRKIYRSMCHMFETDRVVDFITLVAEMKSKYPDLELGEDLESYLIELSMNVASHANFEAYADLVVEAASEALNYIEQMFELDGKLPGMSTGLHRLDELLSGLQRSDLFILAARPSMGKTALALNIARHIMMQNKEPVLVFSLEMTARDVALRIIADLGAVSLSKIRSGNLNQTDFNKIGSAICLVDSKPLDIDDSSSVTIMDIRNRCRKAMKERGDLGLVVIDYLQLIQTSKGVEHKVAEIGEISRNLKLLARELNVCIILLSQLNRNVEHRTDKRPQMSDLRDSGSIEQDADVVAFIYRDDYYNENSENANTAEIIIAKHRNGPVGKVRVGFVKEHTKFIDVQDGSYGMGA